jgi:hypothetical protein
MLVKTSELIDGALDWAFAQAAEHRVKWSAPHEMLLHDTSGFAMYAPHRDWSLVGPIIDRVGIRIAPTITRSAWMAQIRHTESHPLVAHPVLAGWTNANGPTPLIAAMRCYCRAKLGDTVDIPDELIKKIA